MVRLQVFHGARLMMKAAAMLRRAASSSAAALPRSARATLVNTPLFHVSGLYAGAVTVARERAQDGLDDGPLRPERVMRLIEREQVTAWGPMGTMMHRVLAHPDFARLRPLELVTQLGSGGAPISRRTARAHARGLPERALVRRDRLRPHRVDRARDDQLAPTNSSSGPTRSGARCRRSTSRSATPTARRCPRASRARSACAVRS